MTTCPKCGSQIESPFDVEKCAGLVNRPSYRPADGLMRLTKTLELIERLCNDKSWLEDCCLNDHSIALKHVCGLAKNTLEFERNMTK